VFAVAMYVCIVNVRKKYESGCSNLCVHDRALDEVPMILLCVRNYASLSGRAQ
jgi:hypothetical protein